MATTTITDFRKCPPRYTILNEDLFEPATSNSFKAKAGHNQLLQQHPNALYDPAKQNLDYPASSYTVSIRNELGADIWVIWRFGAVQMFPSEVNANKEHKLFLTATYMANTHASPATNCRFGSNEHKRLFTKIDNPCDKDKNLRNNLFLFKMAETFRSKLTYNSMQQVELKPIKTEVTAGLTYDDIHEFENGVYLPEFDVVIATHDVSSIVQHPSIIDAKAGESPAMRVIDDFHPESFNFSLFIADRKRTVDDIQYTRVFGKLIKIPVIRNFSGQDGVYFLYGSKYDQALARSPHAWHDYLTLEEGFKEFGIKSNIAALDRDDIADARKYELEKMKLNIEEQGLLLKQKDIEFKALELKFQTALNIHKTNNEHRRDSINHYRGEIKTIKEEQKEDRRFKRDMLSDTAKMITTVLSLAAAIVIFANKSK